jgi:ketosteroid isomerase-like protein
VPVYVVDEESLREALRLAAPGFELLAPLGGSPDTAAFLAKRKAKGTLAVLRVEKPAAAGDPPTLRWSAHEALDPSEEFGTVVCTRCGSADQVSPETLALIVAKIRADFGGGLRVHGMIPMKGGGGLVVATDGDGGTTRGFIVESSSPDEEVTAAGTIDAAVPVVEAREAWQSTGIPSDFFDGTPYQLEPQPGRRWFLLLLVLLLVLVAGTAAAMLLLPDRDRDRDRIPAGNPVPVDTTASAADSSNSRAETRDSANSGARGNQISPRNAGDSANSPDGVISPPPGPSGTPPTPGDPGEKTRSPAPPPAPADDAADELPVEQRVMRAVDAYVAAVRAQDLARLRSAYPGILSAEVARWRGQFEQMRGATGVQVQRSVERGPEINGDAATVIFTLTLRYTDAAGARRVVPMPLRAVLRRDGAAWRLDKVLGLY